MPENIDAVTDKLLGRAQTVRPCSFLGEISSGNRVRLHAGIVAQLQAETDAVRRVHYGMLLLCLGDPAGAELLLGGLHSDDEWPRRYALQEMTPLWNQKGASELPVSSERLAEAVIPLRSAQDREEREWATEFYRNHLRPPRYGFIGNTLVHTKIGLVPIERLKVGDWVLSQPQTQGESAYRRVVRIARYDDSEICLVGLYGSTDPEHLGATANHRIWQKDVGWTRVDHLGMSTTIELFGGSDGAVLCSEPVYKIGPPEEGVGFVAGAWGVESNDGGGARVDFRGDSIAVGAEEVYLCQRVKDEVGNYDFQSLIPESVGLEYRTTVFNIEVEEFNTYYVGSLGAWVHSKPA
jgi:hypothetical protein